MAGLGQRIIAAAALAAALTALMALLALPAAAPASHLTGSGSAAGPGVAWGFNEDWGWRHQEFRPKLASKQLRYAGQIMPDSLSAHRFHVQWATVEDRRGKYRWGRTDRVYEAMKLYGARPVLLLYNAPWWARDPHARCRGNSACAYPPIEGHDVRSFVIHRFQVGAEGGFWNGTAVVQNGLVPKPAYCELGAAIGIPCEDYLGVD